MKFCKLLIIILMFSQCSLGAKRRDDWRQQEYYALKKIKKYPIATIDPGTPGLSINLNKKSHLLFFVVVSLQIIIPPAQAFMQPTSGHEPQTGICSDLNLIQADTLAPANVTDLALLRQGLTIAENCIDSPNNHTCQDGYYDNLPFFSNRSQIEKLYKEIKFLAEGGFHKVFQCTPWHPRDGQNGDIVLSIEKIFWGENSIPAQLRLQGLLVKNSDKTAGADRFLVKALGIYLGPILTEVGRLNIAVSRAAIEKIERTTGRSYWYYALKIDEMAFFLDFSRTENFPKGINIGEISTEVVLKPISPKENGARLPLLFIEYELLYGDVGSCFPNMDSEERRNFLLEFFIVEKLFNKSGLNLGDPRDNQVGLRQVKADRLYLFNGIYYLFSTKLMPVFLDADLFKIRCDAQTKFAASEMVERGYLISILRRLNLTLEINDLSLFEIPSSEADRLIEQGIEFHNVDQVQCGALPQGDWNS